MLLGVLLLACASGLRQAGWYLWLLVWSIPLPLAACEFGWMVGRDRAPAVGGLSDAEDGRRLLAERQRRRDPLLDRDVRPDLPAAWARCTCSCWCARSSTVPSRSRPRRRPPEMDWNIDLNTAWFLLIGVLLGRLCRAGRFRPGRGRAAPAGPRRAPSGGSRINAIGPVWDGNEVWLLTGGGALFAAFPVVYATVFSGFYLAFMLLLFALIFRAVSLEFRGKVDSPGVAAGLGLVLRAGQPDGVAALRRGGRQHPARIAHRRRRATPRPVRRPAESLRAADRRAHAWPCSPCTARRCWR